MSLQRPIQLLYSWFGLGGPLAHHHPFFAQLSLSAILDTYLTNIARTRVVEIEHGQSDESLGLNATPVPVSCFDQYGRKQVLVAKQMKRGK